MKFRCTLFALHLFAACGSPNSDRADAPAALDALVAPSCQPVTKQVLSKGIMIDAVLANGVATALIHEGAELRVVTPTSNVVVATVSPNVDGALAADSSGRVCVVYRNERSKLSNFQFACGPTWTPVDTQRSGDSDSPHLVHQRKVCSTAKGCAPQSGWVLYYQGKFASAKAVEADDSGATWIDRDLFISSVTAPYGSADLDGQTAACVGGNGAAVLVTNHPFRGELDAVARWSASSDACQLAARGRDVSMLFSGPTTLMLAQWSVPLLPDQMWPQPPAAIATPLLLDNPWSFGAAQWGDTLAVAYNAVDGTLNLATLKGSTWNTTALGGRPSGAPRIAANASTVAVFVNGDDGVELSQQCQP
jgi:hypothetical protein